ncbi:MAG TPA: NAD(P)-binding domain-containing protein [Actinomycetes bacterium]|nr:NAD(P)-binding domain-containing protein [Actinomycetes bacterium]
MRLGVLGTGVVGQSLASGWLSAGHDVMLGSRSRTNEVAVAWAAESGRAASNGTFADAVEHAEVVVNCTPGEVSLSVLNGVDTAAFGNKVVLDVSNPLDFSAGFPPTLSIVNDDSLGEAIQRCLPEARVVKSLNTVTASVMVEPSRLDGRHDLFVAGNDATAKRVVTGLLADLGWDAADVHDLGGIDAARGIEMYLPLWLRLMGTIGGAEFNVHVVRSTAPSG